MIYWNKITGSTCADNHPNIIRNTPLHYYPLVTNLFTIIHDTNFSSSWTSTITASIIRSSRYLSSSLSRNGSRLASEMSKFNLSLTVMESGVLTQGIIAFSIISQMRVFIFIIYMPIQSLLTISCVTKALNVLVSLIYINLMAPFQ